MADRQRMRQYEIGPEKILLSTADLPGPPMRVLIAGGIHPAEAARVLRTLASLIELQGFTPFDFLEPGVTMPGPRIAVRIGEPEPQ